MNFARPLLLLLLAGLPLWWWLRSRAGRPAANYSDVRQLARVGGNRKWVAELPRTLRSLTLVCWIFAAAGPEIDLSETKVTTEGIAIVLAVDVSSSMLAEDFAPSNRLDVAKAQSIEFIGARPDDRVGLVAFAAEALTRIPITVDHAVLLRSVSELTVQVGGLEDGTAIGTALATAANRLRKAPGASKVIVLMTDGENNRGRIDPRTAAEAAAAIGIKVYTIGVGTEGEARMPIGRGASGTLRYQTLPVRIDEALLQEVSETTGGRYFRATDADALKRVFQQIDQLEKSEVTITSYTQIDEQYQVPILLGLTFLAMELLIASTIVVRVP
jgi:Ca-activated chloride channel family protein